MTTLDEFMAIKPNSYMAVVDTWRPQTTQFKEAFDDYKRWAGAPAGTEWTGRTGNAAYEAAATDCHGSDNTDDAAGDIVTLATATITYEVLPNLTGGQNLVERVLAQKDRVSIDQSFNMDYHPAEGESDESIARNREHVKESERLIKEYVAKWEKGCQALKGQAEAAAQAITGCINPKTAFADGRKILRDTAPRTTDPNATSVNYKEMYPKTVAAATDPAAIDPKVAALVPGLDPNATKAAGALAPGSLPELLDAASKAKPPIDPKVGSLTDNLLRIDPTMAARQSHVEKIPGRALDPNSPAGKATVDGLRGLYQSQGLPPAQVEAKVQEALKAGGQDQYAVKFADPNAPSAAPSEHVSRDFGEQFNKFTNGISDAATRTIDGQIEQGKILTGQAGPGAPGVAEAWREVGINAAHQVHELTTDPLAAPKMGIEQAKDFINSPSEFIGKNIIHGTEALATGGIGGEAAAGARGLLGDLTGTEGRALTHGIEDGTPGHHPAPQVEHPAISDHGGSGALRPTDEILRDAHLDHRAERDQMDWDRGEQNLHDLAAHHGVPVDQLPRTPQYDIDHPTYTDKHAADHSAEIDRQTQLWEHGFNTQSVEQVLDNMDGTRPPSTGLRDELRQGLSDYGYEDLRKAGYGPEQAEQLAKSYANEQFPKDSGLIEQPVIHNPDGAIGGYKEALTYGDWQVNNALGNLTKQERDALRAWLQTQDPNAIVNINLGRK